MARGVGYKGDFGYYKLVKLARISVGEILIYKGKSQINKINGEHC